MATSYISYLTRALETDDTPGTFKAELGNLSRKTSNCSSNSQHSNMNNNDINLSSSHGSPKSDSSVSFFILLYFFLTVFLNIDLSAKNIFLVDIEVKMITF